MIIVNYEVYVLEQPRGWMLHARFPRQERETAIAEAKELEQTLNVRVKVVRETYYTDDNLFEEAEVYISGMKGGAQAKSVARPATKSAPSRPAASRPAAKPTPKKPAPAPARNKPPARAAPPPVIDDGDQEPRPRSKRAAKAHHLVGRLLAITAASLAAALLAIRTTPNIIMFLWDMGFRINITPDAYGQLLFAIFVLVFLMTAVPLAIRFLPRQTEIPTFHRPAWHRSNPRPKVDKALQSSLDKLANQALMEEVMSGKTEEEEQPPPEEIELPEIKPDPDDLLAEMEAKRKKEAEQASASQDEELPPMPDPEVPAAVADALPQPGAASVESQIPTVNRFLNGAVNAVKKVSKVLDPYNKFALHLYMAGGIESLCEFKKIGEAGRIKLTISALETLGTKGEMARKFHEKLPEYLLEPRYLGVVQAGRDAMGDYLLNAGNSWADDAHGKIIDVMKDWNKPAGKKTSIVTVMFTDMVGSTDLTQARGDQAAQEIVRRHNSIVRGALAQFGGREIKHTGDGIMASFISAANAVDATIAIQRQVMTNNQRNPDLELHLRIGLNAGEPIEEEDDLFGATVQLAARVCAATNTDQILCTDSVKDLAYGKSAVIAPVGERKMKGFRDPIPLHEIAY